MVQARVIIVEAILACHFGQHSILLTVLQLDIGSRVFVQVSHQSIDLLHVVLIFHPQGTVLLVVISVGGADSILAATSQRSCFKCGYPRHMKRYCLRLQGGISQQVTQAMIQTLFDTLPIHQARGGGQEVRGRPKGRGQAAGLGSLLCFSWQARGCCI